ncbi:NUDIX hydrolase [Bacillus sp. C1]
MYKHTLCFLKRNDEILMLNREYGPLKGLWNGVGGKIESKETPLACIIREVQEETGIYIVENQAQFKGIVKWEFDDAYFGGMYVYLVHMPSNYFYATPKKVAEGVLDWKKLSWLLDKNNYGVDEIIPHILPNILDNSKTLEHRCVIHDNKMIQYEQKELVNEIISAQI